MGISGDRWVVPPHKVMWKRLPYYDFSMLFPLAVLTHWGRGKMATITQATLSNAFSWMKMLRYRLKFHWSFNPKSPTNIPELVQIMAWRRPGDMPFSESMMVRLPTHICASPPQWVNALGYFIWLVFTLNTALPVRKKASCHVKSLWDRGIFLSQRKINSK